MIDDRDIIKVAFLNQYKSKIVVYDTMFDYFNDFKKSDLLYFLSSPSMMNEDIFAKLLILKNLNKANVVKYFSDNYEMIYSYILKNIEFKTLKEIIKLFNHFKDEMIIISNDFDKYDISFNLIQTIDRLGIGKINYSSNEKKLKIMIPKNIKNLIISLSNNNEFIKDINSFTNLKNNINIILATYGVIPMHNLVKILELRFDNSYDNVDYNDILRLSILDENINICSIDNDYIIYNLAFETNEDAINFYYSLDKKLDYKLYNRKQYEDFYDFKNLKKLNPHKELVSYLLCNFDLEKDDIDYFDEFCVIDYIYSSQLNENVAKRNFNFFIKNFFSECSIRDKEKILQFFSEIIKYYPNFKLKGRTISNSNK